MSVFCLRQSSEHMTKGTKKVKGFVRSECTDGEEMSDKVESFPQPQRVFAKRASLFVMLRWVARQRSMASVDFLFPFSDVPLEWLHTTKLQRNKADTHHDDQDLKTAVTTQFGTVCTGEAMGSN